MTSHSQLSGSSVTENISTAITNYYDHTWFDYQFLWLNDDNLAFHFGYYDENVRNHSEALINANRVLAERAGVKAGDHVLDAGCGLGGSSLWLAEHRGARVTGITLVDSQVASARRIAVQRQLNHQVTFVKADYTATLFPDASFDVVWAQESLCHAPDKAAFYREVSRLLRPGGRLIIAEYMRVSRLLDNSGEQLLRDWCAGWSMPDLDTPDEHLDHAQQAGLAAAIVDDATALARPSLYRLYNLARLTFPFAVVLRWIGARSAIQHGNTVAALLQYRALESGLWLYGILSASKPRE